MKATFIRTLAELADRDPRIVLLTSGRGSALLPFRERHPERFFSAGVADQSMVGLSTGLAESGFIPFAFSIASLATLQAFEFIRNGPVRHRLPVRVIGLGGGFENGSAGASHYGLLDVGAMRLHSGLRIVVPADPEQARTSLLATWALPGPVYYRLGQDETTEVPGLDGRFELGRAELVREGSSALMITMGTISTQAVAAARLLEQQGISCGVAVLSTLDSSPGDELAACMADVPLVLTVEAHARCGGLGSLIAEWIAEQGLGCRLERCGVTNVLGGTTGGVGYMRERSGLGPTELAETARTALHQLALAACPV